MVPEHGLWFGFNLREDAIARSLRSGRAVPVRAGGHAATVSAKLVELRDLGEFAIWRAARATGDHDLNTFFLRLDPAAATRDLAPVRRCGWLGGTRHPHRIVERALRIAGQTSDSAVILSGDICSTGDHGRRRLGSQSSSDDCIAKNQPPRPAIRDDRHHDVGRCDDPHAPRHLSKAASSGTCRRRGNLSICCTGDRWLWDRDRAPSVGARRFVIRPPGRRFRHMRRDRRKLLSGRARPARGEPKRSRIPHVGPVAGSGMRGQNQSGYSRDSPRRRFRTGRKIGVARARTKPKFTHNMHDLSSGIRQDLACLPVLPEPSTYAVVMAISV